ncbi:hypothetical protein NFJ02_18g31630 [Pycnococcus provasolii]
MALRRRFGRFNGDLLNITRMIKRMVRALWDLFVVGDDDNNNNNNNGGDDDHDGYHGGGGGNDDDDDDDALPELVDDDDDDDDDDEEDEVRVRYLEALRAYNRARGRRGNGAIPLTVRSELNAACRAYHAISDVRDARNASRRERERAERERLLPARRAAYEAAIVELGGAVMSAEDVTRDVTRIARDYADIFADGYFYIGVAGHPNRPNRRRWTWEDGAWTPTYEGLRFLTQRTTASYDGESIEMMDNNPVLQWAEPHLESRRTESTIFTIPFARDVLRATIVVVGRYGVDRRGAESVEASLQGRFMTTLLGHRMYRGITPESNRLPRGENFVENVVFITYLDKTTVDEKIANGEIVVVH